MLCARYRSVAWAAHSYSNQLGLFYCLIHVRGTQCRRSLLRTRLAALWMYGQEAGKVDNVALGKIAYVSRIVYKCALCFCRHTSVHVFDAVV
jgi:hypothetical protein